MREFIQVYVDAYRKPEPLVFGVMTWGIASIVLLGWVLVFGMPAWLHWFLIDFWNTGYSLVLFGVGFLFYMIGQKRKQSEDNR